MTQIKSTAHGNGLFATRDYKIGEYVCTYDGSDIDAAAYTSADYEYVMPNPFTGGVRLGYATPRSADGVGQIANDYARLDMGRFFDIDNVTFRLSNAAINAACDVYNRESQAHRNIIVVRNYKVYATQPITAGDELYMYYGVPYWMCHYRHTNNTILYNVYRAFKLGTFAIRNTDVVGAGGIVNYGAVLNEFAITPGCEFLQLLNITHLDKKSQLMAIVGLIL